MLSQRISDLTAGTPPYATSTLFEVSVDAGGGLFNSRKALMSDIVTAVGTGLNITVSSGNVGIGGLPNSRFQVYGGSNTTPVQIVTSDFNLGSTGSTLGLGFGATTGDTYSSLQAMRGGNVYSTDLVLNSGAGGGNVGIGITTPTHKLHVKTLTGQTDAALFTNSSWTSGTTGTSLQISFGASAGNTYANIRPFLSGNTANGDMVLQGGANVGRVSIGGLIPLARLQVTAEQAATGNSVFNTYDWVSGSVGSAFTIGFGAALGNTYTSLSAYTAGSSANGDIVLQGNTTYGSVGIGTIGAPYNQVRLHITGLQFGLYPIQYNNYDWVQSSAGSGVRLGFVSSAGNASALFVAMTGGGTANGHFMFGFGITDSRLGIGVSADPPSHRLQVAAVSGTTIAAQFNTYDWVNTTTGSSLRIGFGAASGNTYSTLQAYTTGNNVAGDLVLNPSGGTVGIGLLASSTPINNGTLVFQATSNTSLTFKYKGSDGTVRSASLTLV